MSALDGLRVLEGSYGIATAYAGKLLRDQGAEVVKLEPAAGNAVAALVGRVARHGRATVPAHSPRSSTRARRASP